MFSGKVCKEISLMERQVKFLNSGKLSGNLQNKKKNPNVYLKWLHKHEEFVCKHTHTHTHTHRHTYTLLNHPHISTPPNMPDCGSRSDGKSLWQNLLAGLVRQVPMFQKPYWLPANVPSF